MIPNDLILKCFEEHENVLNKTKMLAPVIEAAAALCAHTLQSGNRYLSAVMEEVQLILSILPLSL